MHELSSVVFGLSGIQMPFPQYMYPEEYRESSRLKFYSTIFNSIEINSSHYKLPQTRTITKWLYETPTGFLFTFKIWQEISHGKELEFDKNKIDLFLKAIAAAENKKGALLLQLPPSIGSRHINQLDKMLSEFHKHPLINGWDFAIEFRNSEWYNDNTYKMLSHYNIILVKHDHKKSPSPEIETNSKIFYYRFHGPEGNYRGSYEANFLYDYALRIREMTAEGKKVYVYFNNTMGDAFGDMKRLQEMIFTQSLNI